MTTNEGSLIFATLASALCSLALLWTIREPRIPKWMDFLAAVMLLLFAAFWLGMLQSIHNNLPERTFAQKDLKVQYQVALYLVPFFTAALASNILSHVILSKRDYSNAITFAEAVRKMLWALWLVLLTLSVFGLMAYVAWKKWSKG